MCKSAASNGPYRRINLEILGVIPKLKLKTRKSKYYPPKNDEGFNLVGAKKKFGRDKHVSKRRLFQWIQDFINFREHVSDDNESEEDESS